MEVPDGGTVDGPPHTGRAMARGRTDETKEFAMSATSSSVPPARAHRKFGALDQFSYMLGDVGGSFVNLYIDGFYMVFCTYVMHESPYFMGTMFLVLRLWDAICDPIMGSLPDRFLIGKSGDRFKPYIRIFMVPLALSGILCFWDMSSLDVVWRRVWIVFAYLTYTIAYTGTSMPYGSMASVITADPTERTKLSRARSVGGMFVGILLAIVPMVIWTNNADGTQSPVPSGFLMIAVAFGLCSILAYLGLLKGSIERIHYESSNQGYSYRAVLKGVAHNRPLIGAMIATIGSLIAITGTNQFGSYIYKEYYHYPQIMTWVTLLSMPIALILFPIVPWLVKRFGKRNSILAPACVSLVFALVLLFVPIPNVWVFFALSIVATFGNSVFTMLVWAVVTDCLDYQEVVTGTRADGSVYSLFTFCRQLGSTIASTVASYALGWIGYDSTLTTQTQAVSDHIRTLYTAIPVVSGALIVIGMGLIFNLSREKTEQLAEQVRRLHADKADADAA